MGKKIYLGDNCIQNFCLGWCRKFSFLYCRKFSFLRQHTSAISCIKPHVIQWNVKLLLALKLLPAVYRRIYLRKLLTLSNQILRYKSKCIRMTILCSIFANTCMHLSVYVWIFWMLDLEQYFKLFIQITLTLLNKLCMKATLRSVRMQFTSLTTLLHENSVDPEKPTDLDLNYFQNWICPISSWWVPYFHGACSWNNWATTCDFQQ